LDISEIQRIRGTIDVVPPARAIQQAVQQRFLDLFRLYGYEPIDTPVLESTDLFLRKSGEEIAARMYSFTHWNRNICLRPEFTASVIRAFVNELQDRPLPLRLQYAGPTFRYEKPQRGRYRQFTEVGVECIGGEGPAADAEVLSLARLGLDGLGLSSARFVVGHLGAVLALLAQLGMDAKAQSLVLGVMEHLSRAPGEESNVVTRLSAQLGFANDESEPESSALIDLFRSVGPEQAARIASEILEQASLRLDEGSRSPGEIVERLLQKASRRDPTPGISRAVEFIGKLRDVAGPPADAIPEVRKVLAAYGLDDGPVREVEDALRFCDSYLQMSDRVHVNLALARGLRYYNGLVFEVYDSDDNQIAGGGRYDDLVRALGGRSATPACGFSYGLERVVSALERGPVDFGQSAPPTALVIPVTEADYPAAARIATTLRRTGVPVEVEIRFRGVKGSLRHADRRSIPFAVIVGEAERAHESVGLRDMRAFEELRVPVAELAEVIIERSRTAQAPC